MSYIGHRCGCGHPDIYHYQSAGSTRCENGGCGCRQLRPSGKPEVKPTFGLDGQPVERVMQPGETLAPQVKTHSCPDCKALYKKLTAA